MHHDTEKKGENLFIFHYYFPTVGIPFPPGINRSLAEPGFPPSKPVFDFYY